MRALCLAVTFGLALSLIPMRLPAQPAEEDFARWRADLQIVEPVRALRVLVVS